MGLSRAVGGGGGKFSYTEPSTEGIRGWGAFSTVLLVPIPSLALPRFSRISQRHGPELLCPDHQQLIADCGLWNV